MDCRKRFLKIFYIAEETPIYAYFDFFGVKIQHIIYTSLKNIKKRQNIFIAYEIQ